MAATQCISTPFTAQSTAAEVVDGVDLSGRRVIVTGGASGIGIETARALASAGAEVTLAVRNLAAGERTAMDIITTTGNEHVVAAPLDLADQASVASFTAAWDGPLHILVNNAGLRSAVIFEDIHFRQRAYEPWAAYGQSKMASVLFAVEATKRWASDGITVNALMPGAIRTGLQRYVTDAELDRMRAQAGGVCARS